MSSTVSPEYPNASVGGGGSLADTLSNTSIEDSLDWEGYKGDIPFWQHGVAGAAAGVTEHVAAFPLDTIKTRIQVGAGRNNVRTTFKQVVKEFGIGGLFRGVPVVVSGCIPAHAALFTTYEVSKNILSISDDSECHQPIRSAVCGAISSLSHDLILTPCDVIKQRLQLGCYKGTFSCVKTVISSEGINALFRSMPITVLMNIPYGSVLVATNESLKKVIGVNQNNNGTLPVYFICAGISGAFASVVTTPLDVIKTRLQTQHCGRVTRTSVQGCS
eukprot:GHVR01148800.1.p1 GENE.GHVR01148800.1~~GHVR01148800.1.p1  ORF type:complete len:274 (+),score=63.45 GHVR01148800.1:81-902(+)